MSPFQHGEVFVTEDGAETDLDLGHYERFVNSKMSKRNNFTTGKFMKRLSKKSVGATIWVGQCRLFRILPMKSNADFRWRCW